MALDIPVATARPLPPPPTRRGPAGIEPNATLVDRGDLTPTIARLWIRPDDGSPGVRPGQYRAIGLPVDGRLVQRPYSMASAPGETDELEFLVRLVPTGALTPSLWRLRPGARVRLGPPKGLFGLVDGDPRQHLLVATGTGIAPLRSMLASLVAAGSRQPAGPRLACLPIVVHGVATPPELAYRDELQELAREGRIVYVPAISRPADPASDGWSGPIGRLDGIIGRIAAEAGLDPGSTIAYLCGNPAMIDAVEPRLAELGFPADAIVAEHYWTAQP